MGTKAGGLWFIILGLVGVGLCVALCVYFVLASGGEKGTEKAAAPVVRYAAPQPQVPGYPGATRGRPPSTRAAFSPQPNKLGWNTTDVTLVFQVYQPTQGGHTYVKVDNAQPEDTTALKLSAEGEHVVTFWSVDADGATEKQQNITVRIVKTPPAVMTVDKLVFENPGDARLDGHTVVAGKSAFSFRAPIEPKVVRVLVFGSKPVLALPTLGKELKVDLYGMCPGDCTLTIRAVDGGGSKTDSIFSVKNISATPPTDANQDEIPDEVVEALALSARSAVDDPDADGLSNAEEWQHGTSMKNADTDGDGLPDGWEIKYGLDPLDPTGDNGADGDPDGDKCRNAREYELGTRPNDAASGPGK